MTALDTSPGWVIGTDVGGTFTDLWVSASDGRTRVFKSPTTKDVLGGVLDAIRLAADSYGITFNQFCADIERFGHGFAQHVDALAVRPHREAAAFELRDGARWTEGGVRRVGTRVLRLQRPGGARRGRATTRTAPSARWPGTVDAW